MKQPVKRRRAATALGLIVLGAACSGAESRPAPEPAEPVSIQVPQDIVATAEDSARVAATFAWAAEAHADTLPLGELVARVGQRFLGAPYIAGSLDPPGPERLIVNLRAFDCVTFVESSLALARAIRGGSSDFDAFTRELSAIRYRDGHAYRDRLHYFSDWIATNTARGIVEDITETIGGEVDPRPIHFMSDHVTAYPQLADASNLEAIRAVEARLTAQPRYRIPQDGIARVADQIRSGDVIAATSNVDGLDITHTGLALRVDGRLHLMHAPLAGGVVEISEVPLADRIQRIGGQDGIMVARPR